MIECERSMIQRGRGGVRGSYRETKPGKREQIELFGLKGRHCHITQTKTERTSNTIFDYPYIQYNKSYHIQTVCIHVDVASHFYYFFFCFQTLALPAVHGNMLFISLVYPFH